MKQGHQQNEPIQPDIDDQGHISKVGHIIHSLVILNMIPHSLQVLLKKLLQVVQRRKGSVYMTHIVNGEILEG